jgi:hypothetical protein
MNSLQGSGVTAHLDDHSTDRLQQALRAAEFEIARLRASQSVILSELDRRQVAMADGARTLTEWTAAALDVEPSTARSLVDASRMESVAGAELCSFDRSVAMARLAASGADEVTMRRAWGFDLSSVARIASRRRPTTATHERSIAESRFLMVQPRLDRSAYRISGQLPGLEGEFVAQVLGEAADSLPPTPGVEREPLATRQADGLVDVCQRAVDGGGSGDRAPLSVPHLSIFADARDAAPTNGETGVWLASGTAVGPAALERILCEGTVEVTALTTDGVPLAVGNASTAIPPRTRLYVLHRDGGTCTIDGCRSRYRLQPHHIEPRAVDGNHDPDNLTTICWYHHHVVIHGRGYHLDPNSPPQRRRLRRHWPGRPPDD